MIKKTILTIFILLYHFTFSQNIEISYLQTTSFSSLTTNSTYKLTIMNESSYYIETDKEIKPTDENYGEVIDNNVKTTPFVYKNYNKKTIYYNQPIINKIVYIKDELPLQKWTIIEGKKKIGDYICKKAITTFRGRKYTAWFTNEIPVIGGPWKFDGLPGIILEVYSNDGVLNIKALSINFVKEINIININEKLNNKKIITWDKYAKMFKNIVERIKKSYKSLDDDMNYEINIELIEIIGL